MNTQQHPQFPEPFAPPASYSAPPARTKRFSNEQVVSIVLACAGIGVTLIGVVLLLVMAAREGLLTPPVRVAGGALLAGLLAGAASWVRSRPGGRVGSVALLATGSAAAFFDVVAVTRIYDWVPLAAGLGLALLVGVCAATQAIRWEEKYLFHAVVLSVGGLAPFLTGASWLPLVAFLAVLQVAGLAPELQRQWDSTALVRTLPAICAAGLWSIAPHDGSELTMLAGCGVVAAVGVGGAWAAAVTRTTNVQAALAVIGSWIPLAVAAARYDRPIHAAVDAAMLVVALGVAFALRSSESMVRLALLVLAAVSAVMLALCASFGDWRAVPFLVTAVALNAVHLKSTRREWGLGALAAAALGFVLEGTVSSYVDLFYHSKVEHLPISVPVAGILFLAFAAVGALAIHGKNYSVDYVQLMLVTYGGTFVLGMSMLTLVIMGGTQSGFFLGHLIITVLSLALAALVLTAGLSHARHLGASMMWGLALVACALLKLFFFDLHYMGTMTKAFTFMAAGLVLLAAGTVYARTYAVASRSTTPPANPSQSAMEFNSSSNASAAWRH